MSDGATSDCSSLLKGIMHTSGSVDALARDECILCFFPNLMLYVSIERCACLHIFLFFVIMSHSGLIDVTQCLQSYYHTVTDATVS